MFKQEQSTNTSDKQQQIKEKVQSSYGKIAKEGKFVLSCGTGSSCCNPTDDKDIAYSEALGYSKEEATSVPVGANLGLGCGNPTAIASLKEGDTVLDLGSGAGFDCFLAARKVGNTGKVIGVDMTPDMLSKARINATKGNYTNVEFRLGEIESLPVADKSVDVIISNCVINLSTQKAQVFKEAARVLKEGGRLAISDVVATDKIPAHILEDLELFSGCMGGATPIEDLKTMLQQAGFEKINITIKEESRSFIKGWSTSGAENFVASAYIEAVMPSPKLENQQTPNVSPLDSNNTSGCNSTGCCPRPGLFQ